MCSVSSSRTRATPTTARSTSRRSMPARSSAARASSRWRRSTARQAIADAMARSLDYSERLTRARIEKIPDGVYEGSDFLEPVGTAGWPQDLIPVQVKITVDGSRMVFDYTGTRRAGAWRRELPVLGAVQLDLVHRQGDHRSDDPDQPGLLSPGRDHLPGRHGAQLHLSGVGGQRRDRDFAAHHRHAAADAVAGSAGPCDRAEQ